MTEEGYTDLEREELKDASLNSLKVGTKENDLVRGRGAGRQLPLSYLPLPPLPIPPPPPPPPPPLLPPPPPPMSNFALQFRFYSLRNVIYRLKIQTHLAQHN